MINSTFGGFMTARQGMAASQHGLNLTGHNLTNSATKGYTRQRIDQVSLNFNGTYRYASQYNVNVGNGVLVTGTSQLRDPFLDLRYRNEVAHVGEQDIKLEVLNDLQSILDEVKNVGDDTLGDGGIFNQLGDVLAKLQQLSNEVGNREFDNMVKSSCQALTTLFQSYDKRIQEVEDNLAYDLENVDVPRVNEILKSIRDLNKTIKSSEIMGNSALELKDQRNLLIDELSNYMKINVYYKPVKVSDSTTVDELTIHMVGSDGNKYALVADEQVRELILTDDGNQKGPGDYNISLSALSPVDTELKAELQNALTLRSKAEAANTPATLLKNYTDAYDAFKTTMDKHTALFDAVYDANSGTDTLFQKAEGEKDTAWAALSKAIADANTNTDPAKTAELMEAVTNAQTAYDEKYEAFITARIENTKATTALKKYEEETYTPAKEVYEAAVEALPADPFTEIGLDKTNYEKNLVTGLTLVGGGGAAADLKEAQEKYEKALENLGISEESGKAIGSINDLLVDGSLKGTLEMLNYSAEFDNPPNTIRGIGYFHNMLDTLAYEFATKMNEANNPAGVTQKDANGNPITGPYDLFKSEDGQKIDAGNIAIADGWVNNTYGITASKDPNASSGSNDNILHMISMFGEKMGYKASEDLLTDLTTTANTTTTRGLKPGDTITVDGKTYTYVVGATGANGTEFDDSDAATLKKTLSNALSKNGMTVTIDANGNISAQTATQDLSTLVTVNTDQISKLSDIHVDKLTYGDTITIDGKTFTYKPNAPEANGADKVGDGIFKDFATLQKEAEAQNIKITGTQDANGTEGMPIQSITRIAGKTEPVVVDKAPNVFDLQNGDTITIGDQTFTYVDPNNGTADITQNQFSNTDDLIAAAAKHDMDIRINEKTGEITSATQVGSNLFTGTFEEFFTNIGGVLGLDIQSTTEMLDNYTQLASTIAENREAVIGVSLDEEAMNIMRYQQSYNASARLMTALDEMLSTLISNTGVVGR